MKRSNVTIRLAKLSDCTICQRLGRVPELRISNGWYLPLQYYQRVVQGKHHFLVAQINHKIVGFIIGERIVSGVLIQYIVVSKKYRQQGIGKALLQALEKSARHPGVYYIMGYGVVKSRSIQTIMKQLGYHRGQLAYEWSKGLT